MEMPHHSVPFAIELAVAAGTGLLIGLEREWAQKDLGTRTFTLTALLGLLSGYLPVAITVTAFAGVLMLGGLINWHSLCAQNKLETTTATALLASFVLGALAAHGHPYIPIAAAIVIVMLLAWKTELHRFAGGLRREEIRSAVLLGLLGFVIYPLLPAYRLGPGHLINPRQAWLAVLLVAGLSFLNYVLLRLYSHRGLYYAAWLGGLLNSTAAVWELRDAAAGETPAFFFAVMAAPAPALCLRNWLILALLAPAAAWLAAPALLAMAALGLGWSWSSSRREGATDTQLGLPSPISLRQVFSLAAVLVLLATAGGLAQRHMGGAGWLGLSLAGGTISSAATAAASALLTRHRALSLPLAALGVVAASIASLWLNLALAWRSLRRKAMAARLAWFTLALSALGLGGWWLTRLL